MTHRISVLILGVLLSACHPVLDPQERHLVILATNDIHGSVEPTMIKGERAGGMAIFSGIVRSIRKGIAEKYGESGGVLVLDAGDQFQGTLISNATEGELVFDLMNQVGYDAAIPGNHDYDFGPKGWLVDTVKPGYPDQNPRSVIESLARRAHFPLLSANTYYRASIRTEDGQPISDVKHIGCVTDPNVKVDWARAERPSFLKPFLIKKVAGVRVALIGIDNVVTPKTTKLDNISDLCFRDELDTYRELRRKLADDADVFIMILHNGNSGNEYALNDMLRGLTEGDHPLVDAIIGGHTHQNNSVAINGVFGIQSGANGQRFGRIDLVWNVQKHEIDRTDSKRFAAIVLSYSKCDGDTTEFCSERANDTPIYESVPVDVDKRIEKSIAKVRKAIGPMATRVLGKAEQLIKDDRISENPLADALTDAFREVSGADVAFLNMGGLRATIPAGDVTYEDLFRVLPFSNEALVVGPMSASQIYSLVLHSVQTCGKYGALMPSGIKVTFTRHCDKDHDVDLNAKVLKIELLNGQTLDPNSGTTLRVATLDFLMDKTSEFNFQDAPVIEDLGIFRELLVKRYVKNPAVWTGEIDHRWVQVQEPETLRVPTPTEPLRPER